MFHAAIAVMTPAKPRNAFFEVPYVSLVLHFRHFLDRRLLLIVRLDQWESLLGCFRGYLQVLDSTIMVVQQWAHALCRFLQVLLPNIVSW